MYSKAIPQAAMRPSPYQLEKVIDVGGAYVVPPTGRVFFVRGDGSSVTNYDDQYTKVMPSTRQLFPSVASVLASTSTVKASRGDTIIVLPGHTENIATADAWSFVAGVRILGLGQGNTRPTFTFSAAAATLLVDVAGVTISGCRFLCAGPAGTTALTVAAPFTVSGEGSRIIDNYFQVGIDADQICTTFMTITGDNVSFVGNVVECAAVGAEITDCIVLTGADGVVITDNYIKVTVGVAQGAIRSLTTASTGVIIERNFIYSWKASSTSCINFTAALANTGIVANNRLRVTTDGGVAHIGVNAAGDLSLYLNYGVNAVNETGLQVGTAST